ncbi:MAG: hypothetical protein ABF382_04270 [Akkermansiaceae bacterium]
MTFSSSRTFAPNNSFAGKLDNLSVKADITWFHGVGDVLKFLVFGGFSKATRGCGYPDID